jgi:hypothetical protein
MGIKTVIFQFVRTGIVWDPGTKSITQGSNPTAMAARETSVDIVNTHGLLPRTCEPQDPWNEEGNLMASESRVGRFEDQVAKR